MKTMKVKIIGHYISPRGLTWFPWWYDKKGEWIDVKDDLFFWEISNSWCYQSVDYGLIEQDDVLTLNQIREKKIKRIIE